MTAGNRQKKLFSTPAKAVVTVLLFLGVTLCSVFGLLFLQLMNVSGGDPIAYGGEVPYYATPGCGWRMTSDLLQLSEVLNINRYYDTDGKYDPSQLVDITQDYSGGMASVDADENVSYTIDDLYQMYVSGLAEELSNAALDSDYMDSYTIYTTMSEEGSMEGAAGADESESGAADEFFAPASSEASADVSESEAASGGNGSASASGLEAQEEIALSYMDSNTWEHLLEIGTADAYSNRFLYLYGRGYPMEEDYGFLTAAGSTLADYAAANPEDVSLRDLYTNLISAAESVYNYVWNRQYPTYDLGTNTNLKYYVTDGEAVYTNGTQWNSLTEEEVAALVSNQTMHFSYVRENGRLTESDFPDTAAGYQLANALASQQMLSQNERVCVSLDTSYPVEDGYREEAQFFAYFSPYAALFLVLAVIGLVTAIVAFVLCTIQAGRNGQDKAVQMYGFDAIPTEAAAALGIILGVLFIGGFGGVIIVDFNAFSPFWLVVATVYICASVGLFMIFYLSLVRRIKAHNLWEKSLIRAVVNLGGKVYEARKESTRLIVAGIGLMLLHFIFLTSLGFFGILLCLVVDVLVLLYMLREAAGKQNVIEGMRQLGSGNLDYKVEMAELNGNNRELAEVVNSMGDGLKAAVKERMKNERMQADLITNVSHDIKTPLTSIINYVDLLKRENIEDPKIKGYIDILDRKSQRLKQLAEDLVEASKVSSGNVKLEFVVLNLNELIQQVNGEFDERLTARELQMICSLSPEPALVRADSRYLWRVVENLYGNVAKYAMPGSRVYVAVERQEGRVIFTIKNMSEQTLNVSPDELMERFVRGDSSRTTEGSGLGLSIARNLAKLMDGTLEITVDGDLFKVQVAFPEVVKQETRQEADPEGTQSHQAV